ncbi:MAG: CoB--CoM heterodisulfide reductase iron-sulfur subunit A family protein, partial [Euryarchaeota archaeon]|nr:CoB--CoM heterodisulfide reductase iron-sulfur subunit A family protein [Euryarchaeota archaeon]
EPLFRSTCEDAGLNPYLFEMTNIREHCSWVHSQEPEKATAKAKDLVRMAVAKVRLLAPQQKGQVDVERSAIVLGGGVAGMTAAMEIASQGFQVHLVERSGVLGGATMAANTVFFSGRSPGEVFGPLAEAVSCHPNIKVHLHSALKEIKGFRGNFDATILEGGREETHKVGGILLATGSRELKPEELYLYGSEGVMTLGELEGVLKRGDKPRSTVFIQCVGARTKDRPYCSRTCCLEAVKNAAYLKERDPGAEVYILYRDMMTFGLYEDEYRRSQALGVRYLKYSPENPPRVERADGGFKVSLRDTLLGAEAEMEVERVVLSTPQVPAEGAEDLAKLLKVPRSPDGFFMEGHAKLRPLEFTQDGLYLCGSCQGPKELPHIIAQASGAAARVCALLSREVLETEATTAIIDEELCVGCGRCTKVCVFGALALEKNERGEYKSRVNSALCKSCGACAAVCPNGAITPRNFSREQIIAMIDQLLEVDHGV